MHLDLKGKLIMSNEITVKLDWDTVDGIIVDQLESALETLKVDYENRKSDSGMAIFDIDKKTDIKLIKKHIKAIKLILSYYSVNGYS